VADALVSYRDATDRATRSLVAAAKGRPVFIYCAGPSAEAVIRTLQRAHHDVRAVVDDNPAFAGGALLGVPIVTAGELAALGRAERAAAFIVICIQKRIAAEKIAASLKARGFAASQIAHRLFEPGALQPDPPRLRAAAG